MGFFSFLFGGKYPSTKKYEAQLNQKAADYERHKAIAASAEFAKFKELGMLVDSSEFKAKVNKLKTEKFSDTEAYRKETEYKQLRDSNPIKQYYKFVGKQMPQRLELARNSAEYKRYTELEATISTPEFKAIEAQPDFKKTPEYMTLKEYNKVRKASATKFVKKTEESEAYNNYLRVKDSDNLKKCQELEQYVNSNEFKTFKAYMEDSKKFKKSPEAQTIKEFEDLANSKEITWYIRNDKDNVFEEISKMKLIFEDNFDSFDKQKWGVGNFAGNAFAGGTIYSQIDERQITSAANISASASELSLSTRKQEAKGKRWNPTLGFVNSEFEYTSAQINSGNSFRQLYGRFMFKVKMTKSSPIVHTIWMQGEKNAPIINVVSYGADKKNIIVGSATEKNTKKLSVDGADFTEYYIYTLDWTANKLSWKINGKEVFSQTDNVPQTPMFINIGSSITAEGDVDGGAIVLDWIKVYDVK